MLFFELLSLVVLIIIQKGNSQLFQLTSLASSITNNFTLVNGVTYDLNFSMTSQSIQGGSTVGLKFSQRFFITTGNLANCRATTSSASVPATVPCSVAYYSGASIYEVTFNNIFSTTTTYSFLRLQFQIPNPYAEVSQPINLTIYNTSSTMIGYGIAYISTYKASTMSSCSITSGSMIAGVNSTHRYQFTPAQRLLANSYLLIQMPIWYGTTGSQVTSFPICTGLQGTDSTSLSCSIQSPVTTQTLNITSGLVSSNKSAVTIILSIADLKNPWSLQPFGPITVSLMSGLYLTQVCYNVYNTVTTPNTLSVFTFSLSNLSIGATNTNVRLVFFPTNPFPKPGNRVMLEFPSQLTVTYGGTISVNSQNSTQITLASVSVYSISGFTVVNPPSTRTFTLKATTFVVSNSVAYAIQSRSISVNCLVGSITSANVVASNTQVNSITTYTVSFTITNRLQSGSFIQIVFPSQLSIQGGAACSLSGHSCTVKSSNNVSATLSSAVTGSTALTITITNVKNAVEALTSSSFAIYSYFDSLYDSLVNQVTTGVTVTMTAKVITAGTVTPSSVTTFATTSYKIDQTLLDPIPIGGYIQINFPNTVLPQTVQINAASFSFSSCVVNKPSTYVINITGCFTSALINLNLSLNLSNIINPPSFKPTDSFKIYVRGTVGSLINYVETGISVSMSVAASTTSLSITPSSYIVGASTSYSFQIVHAITPHSINDYVIVNFPSLMTIPSSPSCSAVSGLTSISCMWMSNTQLKATYTSTPSTTIQFSMSSVTNYLVGDQAVTYSTQIFNSQNYKMEEFLSQSVTYVQSTITSVGVNNDSNIALGELSNITLTVNNAIALYSSFSASLTKLQITIPPQFTIGTACTVTTGSCAVSASKYVITGIGLSLVNQNITMTNILLNYYNPTSSSFQLVYTYNGFNVSAKISGVVLSIFCTSPCQRCSTGTTVCESCLPAPNTKIYHDPQTKTCVSVCVAGKYPDSNKICQLCVSPCSTCLDSVNCSSCVNNTWLYQATCVTICPSTYYNSSNGKCQQCQSPCNQCSSLTNCTNCITGYLTNNWCVNASSCPNGTYANQTTKKCQSCQSPCSTCSLTQANCTACQSGYLYYDNKCVQNCPAGMYQSSIYCFNCVGLCATCTNSTYCTSCSSNYLNMATGTCVDPSNCPSATYANSTTLQCNSCPTGCTACLNSTNCTSCNTAIYVFYNYACLTVCPAGTYKSGFVCLDCTYPCQNCRGTDTNCSSCVSPKLLYQNTCVDVCPNGTYNDLGTCTTCRSICSTCSSGTTCDSCVSPYYLESNTCVSNCSAGYYGNNSTSTCLPCTAPCSQCSIGASNCTKCIAPQLQYLNGCVNSCPATYFEVNGSCKTCPNCVSCLDSTTCGQCKSNFYLLNGVCYTTCPETAPIPDDITNTCGRCDITCLTCSFIAKNCTSCYSNTFLYKGTCLTECPLGFIQDLVSGTCKQPLIGNVIYFPFSFLFLFFFIVTIASKCMFKETQIITTLGSTVSLCEFGSWCLLAYIVTVDYNLQSSLINIVKYVALACVLMSIGVGVAFIIVFYKQYEFDKGLLAWKQHQMSCVYAYRAISVFSCTTFRFFRTLYCRFYNRTFLTMYIANGQQYLTTSNRLTFVTLLTNSLPMMIVCGFTLYKKQIYDQTFFSSLDTLILGFLSAVLLTIDSCKNKDHFQSMKDGLPFLKYKNFGNDDSIAGESLLSRLEQQRERPKSQVNKNDRDNIFKKISWLPNLNKFGHLNVLQDTPDDKDEIKSLPQLNKLGQFKQYDINQYDINNQQNRSFGDRVVDDLLFLQQQQERRRRQQQQQQRRKKQLEQQQERRRLKRLQQQEQQRKREQQQRRRRQLMQQDERQRIQLQFPDLAAIDKVENKNKSKKNPLDLLSNCKKVDQKVVDDKALKKLQQIGKKNGIDPNFMKQTFGVQKNHNPQLLNQIIDKHNHVKRQSIKQLFNSQNNPEILQQLFGKNSKMDPKKLRQILNDPDSHNLIKKLADKEEGILSPEMAKQLFDENGKYSPQYIKNLLSDNNGMDSQKLKTLLKQNNGKGKDSPLKALKKIGGDNLQNKQLLNNMLGQNAVLDPQNFTKVANDLSIKAIQNIFKNKSQNNDIITKKILNNKKLNLKNLVPILQDQELLQQLAQALGSGDQNLQQNLINLFKNGENIDPAKLKQLLADPILRQKLLSKPIDPSFLESLLDKNSNSDLKILSQALKHMSDQAIEQTFRFDPQKNIDFKNLASLFDKNPKTDPALVAKMLEPDMVKKLYVKGNDTKMLNKLVQKGNQFDPQVIKNVYGDQRNIFDTKTDNMHNNLLNFDQDKASEFRSQKQYSLGFQKNKSQANMSRTAGGVLSFLTPIVPVNNNKFRGRSKQFEQANEDGWTSRGQQQDEDGEVDQDDEDNQKNMKGRRRKKGTKTKKKLVDIRHPAQQIYLQRIEAPHQAAMRKVTIRKKKKKVQNPGVMDEDNDIFDMDF